MKATLDTITDEQILALRHVGEHLLSEAVRTGTDRTYAFDVLLVTANALMRNLCTSDGNGTWNHWRTRCAEMINAHASASACPGRNGGPHTRAPLDPQCIRCQAPLVVLNGKWVDARELRAKPDATTPTPTPIRAGSSGHEGGRE